tara:strand:- start:172 stop:834 length:663 start_codon:yes stop_codon:yes gene_type:complete
MSRVLSVNYNTHKLYFAENGFQRWPIRRFDYYQWIHDLIIPKYRTILDETGNKSTWKTIIKIYSGSSKILEYPWNEPMFLGDATTNHAFPMAFNGSYEENDDDDDDDDEEYVVPELPDAVGIIVFTEPLQNIPTHISSSSFNRYYINKMYAEYDSPSIGKQIKDHLLKIGNSVSSWKPLPQEEEAQEEAPLEMDVAESDSSQESEQESVNNVVSSRYFVD